MNRHAVLTRPQLVTHLAIAVAIGAVLAGAATAFALAKEPPAEFGSAEIVRQDDNVTVARIPARRGEVMSACVVFIDYRARTWAISC